MAKYEIYNAKHKNNWSLDIYFDSMNDAVHVLDSMIEISEEKGKVSMADYFSLSAIPDFNEEITKCLKWKHDDIRNARITRNEYGYKINLPKNVVIEERSAL